MRDLVVHEEPGRPQNQQTEDNRFRGRRSHVSDEDLHVRDRRGKQFVDRPGELRHVDAERSIGDALVQKGQHRQPWDDEGAVADPTDLGHARTDRRSEHHEIERSGQHRRDDALHQRSPRARHLEQVDRSNGVKAHRSSCTRLTKISSSELWLDWRSLKSIPCSLSFRKRPAIPVRSCCASNV